MGKTITIRIDAEILAEVTKYKEKTGIPITAFVNKSVSEKLKRIKSKKKL